MDCAVVGCGAAAERYLTTVDRSPLSISAVCDTDIDRARALGGSHDATAYADLEALLAAEEAPLVLNLTSHAAHAPVTRQCLSADRHVWSEKPLAADPATAFELVELATARDRGLGCAPVTPCGPAQRQVRSVIADGRLGSVRLGAAHAHVGRVHEWHERPASFLTAGPLLDGAVYPLSLLVEWYGAVDRVRSADAMTVWPDGSDYQPDRPTHVEATLDFGGGPVVRLTASFYVPHRSREFTSLELHGDDGSVYLADAGDMGADAGADAEPVVSFAGQGRDYTPMPRTDREPALTYLDGPERLATQVRRRRGPRRSARRAAHVVDVCSAIETTAAAGGPRPVSSGFDAGPLVAPNYRPDLPRKSAAIRLPPIGFGTARYRDGVYVDRRDSIATALDAGYRFFDTAELYGNEHVVGDLLASRGTPDRRSVFLASKVWNTNHGHVAEACETTLRDLRLEALDCYLLHWPDSWAYTGPLSRLADRPSDEQEARTFPRNEDGDIRRTDIPLERVWRDLEGLLERGTVRSLGICNVDRETLEHVLDIADIPPAVVQVECHPYRPRSDLVSFCHERGIRVVAHTPLNADGLLTDPRLEPIADELDASVAQVVLAWNVHRGVVPIPSSTEPDHVVENLAGARLRLPPEALKRVDQLAQPGDDQHGGPTDE